MIKKHDARVLSGAAGHREGLDLSLEATVRQIRQMTEELLLFHHLPY